jgi:pimeloyl-ACP methyl ester carboxylesterase
MVEQAQYENSSNVKRPRRRLGAGSRFGAPLGWGRIALVMAVALLWSHGAFATPRVLLLRGWFGLFSTGLDGIADALKAKGIDAEVAGHLVWETAVDDILRDRAAGKIAPIVLIGHSQGANNVIDMARALQKRSVRVDLLVTLAPFMQDPIPANVMRAINYYQSPGWGAPLSTDVGFHGKLSNVDVSNDWTITHVSIDKSQRIHDEIVREIDALAHTREGVAGAADTALSRNRPAGESVAR